MAPWSAGARPAQGARQIVVASVPGPARALGSAGTGGVRRRDDQDGRRAADVLEMSAAASS